MEQENKKQYNTAETYAEDMAHVIEDDKGGLIKKIIHGEEEHELERKNLSPESRKNKFFMTVSFLLVFMALITLSSFFFMRNNFTVSVQKQFTPLIFSDQGTFIEMNGFTSDQIIQTITNEVSNTNVKAGGVEGIYPTENKNIIGLREFLRITKSNFVPGNPNLVYDNFLIGAYNEATQPASSDVSTGKDFFMLLKMRSIPDIFDNLNAWENNIFSDLHGFFGIDITSDTNYLLTKSFTDGIVDNKNARILYDNQGNIVMMYIFADDNSVIITNTESAAQEIMLRLASSQITQ